MLKRAMADGTAENEAPVMAGMRVGGLGGSRRAQRAPSGAVPRGSPAPFFRVDHNGILLEANVSGRALLESMGSQVGERMPEYITQLIPGVLLSGKQEREVIDFQGKRIDLTVTLGQDPDVPLHARSRSPRKALVLVECGDSESLTLRALPVALYTSRRDKEGGETWMSPGVDELTGFPPSRFTSGARFWMSRIHPEDRPVVARELAALGKKREALLEYRFLCADGSYRWMRDHMVLPPGLDKSYGIMQDIDRQKKSELAARERNDFLERLVDGAFHGTMVLDEEHCLLFMSPQFAARLGQSASDWVSKRTKLGFHPEDEEAGLKAISNALRGFPGRCTARIRGASGTCIHVQLFTSPLEWRGRRLVLCSAGDISEESWAERERNACEELP